MDSPDDQTAHSGAVTPAPWYQRALPTALCVVVALAVAGTLLPGFRHQLALSFTRQHVSYVELYFARSTSGGAQAACVRKGTSVRVRFVIESHLERRRAVAFRVSVDPSAKGLPTQRQDGSAEISPDRSVQVTKSFSVPRREAFVLLVRLPGFDQQLRVRCAARRT